MPNAVSSLSSFALLALLPLISLVGGILSLYADPQSDQKKQRLLLAVLVLSALATIGMSIHDDKDHQKEADNLHATLSATQGEVTAVQGQLAAAQGQLTEVNGHAEKTQTDVGTLLNVMARTFGYAPETIRSSFSDESLAKQLTASIAADQQRTALLSSKLPAEGSPEVFYYAKAEEAAGVEKALQEVRSLRVTIKERLDDKPSNVIWIGDKIDAKMAQYVAQTLLRAGVKLNKILRFHDSSGKSNLIEIGAYEDYRSSPLLTSAEIATMNNFPTDPKPAGTHNKAN
jgi:hypothetical protein